MRWRRKECSVTCPELELPPHLGANDVRLGLVVPRQASAQEIFVRRRGAYLVDRGITETHVHERKVDAERLADAIARAERDPGAVRVGQARGAPCRVRRRRAVERDADAIAPIAAGVVSGTDGIAVDILQLKGRHGVRLRAVELDAELRQLAPVRARDVTHERPALRDALMEAER